MKRAACISVLSLCFALLLSACEQDPETGPGKIAWDRDTCEFCLMAISDRRFAAQVRSAHDHRLHRFDDLGCALLWLDVVEQNTKAKPHEEIWVRDPQGETWQSAEEVKFRGSSRTPMEYGFRTVEAGEEALLLAQVWKEIRVMESERRSRN